MITFKEYFLENKRYVVTMDFDHNLKFETGKPNMKVVKEFIELQKDFDVYIVTSRMFSEKSKKEIEDFAKEYGLTPKDIIHTGPREKMDTVIKLNSVKHFDDDPKELERIKNKNKDIETINTYDEDAWMEYVKMMDDEDDDEDDED